MNIQDVSAKAQFAIDSIEDRLDYPVSDDYGSSIELLIYLAGVAAMREAVVKQLREGGFNILANNVLDITI